MGIPKFFRWISERYPLCSQLIQENRIPEFDVLYLDMNGIIHACTHANQNIAEGKTLSQEEMFYNIFNYIQFLFEKIQPKQFFYLAVDGVAPRAKINQQRSRRFRSAKEAQENLKKALDKGIEINQENLFDSNCITPGTQFMESLSSALKAFIAKKIEIDSAWKSCKIIFSGHEVPGEGEHKIMEFIRYQKKFSGIRRHCLYGLDADLIMLSLLSHEPYFCLLREEVIFGRRSKSHAPSPESLRFFLMHICILRDYLREEFLTLLNSSDEFDLEKIIDDFILMCLFVGNDFLPNLPGFHINEGALETLFTIYKRIAPKFLQQKPSKPCINNSGKILYENLYLLINELSVIEHEIYLEEQSNGDYIRSKTSVNLTNYQKESISQIREFLQNQSQNSILFEKKDKDFLIRLSNDFGFFYEESEDLLTILKTKNESLDDEDEVDEESQLARLRVMKKYDNMLKFELSGNSSLSFEKWREIYHKEKLGISSSEDLQKLTGQYLLGLQWVMLYYYEGVPSWSWFYPYHYAPKITDLANLFSPSSIQSEISKHLPFDKGEPFLPFEQLLGVLPPLSKKHVPSAFRELMEVGYIIDFYPIDFELDLNGKKNDWEAIVKIPFIDETRLREAMKTRVPFLTAEEKRRNVIGSAILFYKDGNDLSQKSLAFPVNFDQLSELEMKSITILDNSTSYVPGFPYLRGLAWYSNLLNINVAVFQQESRNPSILLTLINSQERELLFTLAKEYLADSVFVGWPFLYEALVVSFEDGLNRYSLKPELLKTFPYKLKEKTWREEDIEVIPLDENQRDNFHNNARKIAELYFKKHGVSTGQIEILCRVCVLKGLKRLDNGAMVKDFGRNFDETVKHYPWQIVVPKLPSQDPRYIEKSGPSLAEEFPIGTVGYFLLNEDLKLYGNKCIVNSYSNSKKGLSISVEAKKYDSVTDNLFLESLLSEYWNIKYFSLKHISKELGLEAGILSRLTGSIYFTIPSKRYTVDKINVGFGFKFDGKNQKVIGISRKPKYGWEFSSDALRLISQYVKTFPFVIDIVSSSSSKKDTYDGSNWVKELRELKEWMKSNGIPDFEKVDNDTEILPMEITRKIEDYLLASKPNDCERETISLNSIPAQLILLPEQAPFRLSSSGQQKYKLGDRILFFSSSNSNPMYGTVIGFEWSKTNGSLANNDQTSFQNNHLWVHVIFDLVHHYSGCNNLDGKLRTNRGLVVNSDFVLNVSNPQPPMRRFVATGLLKTQIDKLSIKETTGNEKKNFWEAKSHKSVLLQELRQSPTKDYSKEPIQKAPDVKKKVYSEEEQLTENLKKLLNIK